MMNSMRRRRSLPWIYRWSRPIIGAIAIAGALLTAYLTITKLTGGAVGCAADSVGSGCGGVLNSRYATVFGLPLSLFGCLGYLSMATFALSPLLVNPENNKSLRTQLENWTWLLLLAGATAMTVFSSYLMYLLAFVLKTPCPYCISSALFALSMLVLTIMGREWEDLGQIVFTGLAVGMITLVGTLAIYNVSSDRIAITNPTTEPKAPHGWEIPTESGEAEIALAKYTKESGVKMYGAYWCPHCYEQKQLFGKQAFKEVNYIECAPDGENPQTEVCRSAGIKSFPTWEIKGKLDPGIKELDKLAKLTGYQGINNFKYRMP